MAPPKLFGGGARSAKPCFFTSFRLRRALNFCTGMRNLPVHPGPAGNAGVHPGHAGKAGVH